MVIFIFNFNKSIYKAKLNNPIIKKMDNYKAILEYDKDEKNQLNNISIIIKHDTTNIEMATFFFSVDETTKQLINGFQDIIDKKNVSIDFNEINGESSIVYKNGLINFTVSDMANFFTSSSFNIVSNDSIIAVFNEIIKLLN